jgi:hypothetical protein
LRFLNIGELNIKNENLKIENKLKNYNNFSKIFDIKINNQNNNKNSSNFNLNNNNKN